MRGILSVVLSANTSVRLARDGAAHVAGIGHRLNGKPAFNHVVRQVAISCVVTSLASF
jgi:hypothetical protein